MAEVAVAGLMDINTAIQEVLKDDSLDESSKALDKRQALLCVLADNCDDPMY
jgi:small subunit ribosomal protein S12e